MSSLGFQLDAIAFLGGGNMLMLVPDSSIVGNVISSSGSTARGDTLALGGAGSASFNVAQIVASDPGSYSGTPAYAGFQNYLKTGSGTWTLSGTTSVATGWAINQGTLSVSSDGSLGSATGSLTFNAASCR